MTALAEDRAGRWEPFGVTEADFAAIPERDGMRVVNLTLGGGDEGRHGAPPRPPWPCWRLPRRR